MPPKKKKIMKNQTGIEKFLVKKTVVEEAENNSDDEDLQQQVKELKEQICELLEKKHKLECLQLLKPYKLIDISINSDKSEFENPISVILTKQLELKFHEFTGGVITKVNDNELVVKFHVLTANKTYIYVIRLIMEDGSYKYSKGYLPPLIKIQDLLQQYPPAKPKRLLNVIKTGCQVYHDIQNQVDKLKNELKGKEVNIFNSYTNRTILIDFQMVQRATKAVFPVRLQIDYDIYTPRPISTSIESTEMPPNTIKQFKKQCKHLNRYTLWNAFEIISNIGIKQNETVFYLLQNSSSELNKSNVERPITLEHDKSKIVSQILRDFSSDDEKDISNRADESFYSSFNQTNTKPKEPSRFEVEADIHTKRPRTESYRGTITSNTESLNLFLKSNDNSVGKTQLLTQALTHEQLTNNKVEKDEDKDSAFSKDTILLNQDSIRSQVLQKAEKPLTRSAKKQTQEIIIIEKPTRRKEKNTENKQEIENIKDKNVPRTVGRQKDANDVPQQTTKFEKPFTRSQEKNIESKKDTTRNKENKIVKSKTKTKYQRKLRSLTVSKKDT